MLKMNTLPNTLPAGTGELLNVLDDLVPHVAYRPGADAESTVYQQGARDLVDILKKRWENPVPETGFDVSDPQAGRYGAMISDPLDYVWED